MILKLRVNIKFTDCQRGNTPRVREAVLLQAFFDE